MKLLFFNHILLLKTSNNLLLFQKISFNVQRLKISRKNESLFFTQGRYRMHSAWKSKVQNINGPHWDINNELLGGWKILPCFDLWNYSSNIYVRYTSSWGGHPCNLTPQSNGVTWNMKFENIYMSQETHMKPKNISMRHLENFYGYLLSFLFHALGFIRLLYLTNIPL